MKKIALTLSLLLMPTMSVAQQVQQPIHADKVFDLKVKASDINKISNALGKLPYEDVADLIVSLRQQIFIQAQSSTIDNKPVEEKKDVPTPSKP